MGTLHHSSAHSAGAERGSFFSDAARREGISMAAYQQPYIQQYDPEMGYGADDKGLVGGDSYGEFMDKQVRRGFIRNVFGILSVQLLITFAIAASLMSVDGAKLYVQQNAWPGSGAFVRLFGLFGFGIMTMFIQNHVMEIMYSSVGALIFSCYLVFDIQLLMHGKRVQLSPDDYVFAALNLYLDIVQLFLHILRLYGEMSRN